jgi:predicted sulfurtransferase
MEATPYLNLAFYRFARLESPLEYRSLLREYCAGKPFKGTLLLSEEGINGMLSGEETALREFQTFIGSMPPFAGMEYKESWSSGVCFPRMLVKIKKEIIPLGLPHIDPAQKTGEYMAPRELKSWLDERKDFVLLDTRNDYEVDYGTFENAVSFGLKNFRDFPEQLKALPEDAKEKPLVMFCTGGIRCEKASVVAMDQGFKEVYQLDGGILNYFKEVGGDHYEGQCFVFDRRIAVDTDLSEILPTDQVLSGP